MARKSLPVRAKKGLSQNFLTCHNMARKLVSSLEPNSLKVIEAGPGTGALTRLLLKSAQDVIAVEVDEECFNHLENKFENVDSLHLISGSILEFDYFKQAPVGDNEPYSFLSNLPYGITTPVILSLINSRYPFPKIVVTMQKEVADRFCASSGSRMYGRLSILLALYGQVKKLFNLPPSVFEPSPSVMSTAIEIVPQPERWLEPDSWKNMVRVVKAAFCQRRKKISNSLASGLVMEKKDVVSILEDGGFDPGLRAEKISPDEYVKMAEIFSDRY